MQDGDQALPAAGTIVPAALA